MGALIFVDLRGCCRQIAVATHIEQAPGCHRGEGDEAANAGDQCGDADEGAAAGVTDQLAVVNEQCAGGEYFVERFFAHPCSPDPAGDGVDNANAKHAGRDGKLHGFVAALDFFAHVGGAFKAHVAPDANQYAEHQAGKTKGGDKGLGGGGQNVFDFVGLQTPDTNCGVEDQCHLDDPDNNQGFG